MRRPLPQENNMRVYPGGWHWSTVGSAHTGTMEDRILMKIKTTAHKELDTTNIAKTNIVIMVISMINPYLRNF